MKIREDDEINDNADYFGKIFTQIINLWMTDDAVTELIRFDPSRWCLYLARLIISETTMGNTTLLAKE